MTEPHPQQDYIITDSQLAAIEIILKQAGIPVKRNVLLTEIRSRPHTPAAPVMEPKFNSTDLLLLANDEWKRREERKHNHENIPWCAGFINGFLTDKKWARGWVDKIQKDAESLRGGD